MNWFTDKIYDLAASPRGGEGAWSELAAQDAMSPATRASYWAGSEMSKDPRNAAWRSQPRMGDLAAVAAPLRDPTAGPRAMWQQGYPSTDRPSLVQRGVTEALNIPQRFVESGQGYFDPETYPGEQRQRAQRQTEAAADVSTNLAGLGMTGASVRGGASVGSGGGRLLRGQPGGPWEGGIRAYHSSPHDFDRFDWNKLRTGEGANSYGAGFYAAENPAVSGQGGQYWSQFLHKFPKEEMRSAEWLRQHGFDREAATIELQRQIGDLQSKVKGIGSVSAEDMGLKFPTAEDQRVYRDNLRHYYNDEIGKYQERLGRLQGGGPVGPRTYEVNINARPELLLDWDKPLAQQPQREALINIAGRRKDATPTAMDMYQGLVGDPYSPAGYGVNKLSGGDFYRSMQLHNRDPSVSTSLAEAGIPGIRYLDQGSRPNSGFGLQSLQGALQKAEAAGNAAEAAALRGEIHSLQNPTYNYVVTDPSKLNILAKYGVVGTAGGGMAALAAQDQYQR